MNTFDYDSLDQTDIGTNDITILPEQVQIKATKERQKESFHKFTI